MTDLPADLPPPPERPVLPAGDAKTILVDRVREALIALPGYFQSTYRHPMPGVSFHTRPRTTFHAVVAP